MNRELLEALSSVAHATHADIIDHLDVGGPLHRDYLLGQRILVNIEELQRLLDLWRRPYAEASRRLQDRDDLPF